MMDGKIVDKSNTSGPSTITSDLIEADMSNKRRKLDKQK